MLNIEKFNLEYQNQTIFNNCSFVIKKTSITLLKGASGSGKTSLLSFISLLEKPREEQSASKIFLDNKELLHASTKFREKYVRTYFGYIFQDDLLLLGLTVAENIILPLKMDNVKNDDILDELLSLSDELGIRDLLNKYPEEISGGQRQRVAIARALIKKPRIVVADEPTSALDDETAWRVIKLFDKMNKKYGTTFLIATHDKRFDEIVTDTLYIKNCNIIYKKKNIEEKNVIEVKNERVYGNNSLLFFNFYRRAIGRRKKVTRFFLFLFSNLLMLSIVFSVVVFQHGVELEKRQIFSHIKDKIYITSKISNEFQMPNFFFGETIRGKSIDNNEMDKIIKYPEVREIIPKIRLYAIPVDGVENYWKDTNIIFDGTNKKITYPDSLISVRNEFGQIVGNQTIQSTIDSKRELLSENTPDILSFSKGDYDITYFSENKKGIVMSENYLKNVLHIEHGKVQNLEISMPVYVPSYIYKTTGYTFDTQTNQEILTEMYNTVIRKTEIKLPLVGIVKEDRVAFGKENKNLLLFEQTIAEELINNAKLSTSEKEEEVNNRLKIYKETSVSYREAGIVRELVFPEYAVNYSPNIYEVIVNNPENLGILSSKIRMNNKTIDIYNYNESIDKAIQSYQQTRKSLLTTMMITILSGLVGLFLLNWIIMKGRIYEFKILKYFGYSNLELFFLLLQENILRSSLITISSTIVMFFMFPTWISEILLTKGEVSIYYSLLILLISTILLLLSSLAVIFYMSKKKLTFKKK